MQEGKNRLSLEKRLAMAVAGAVLMFASISNYISFDSVYSSLKAGIPEQEIARKMAYLKKIPCSDEKGNPIPDQAICGPFYYVRVMPGEKLAVFAYNQQNKK